MVDTTYNPARKFCDNVLAHLGIETTYYDPAIGSGIADLIAAGVRMVQPDIVKMGGITGLLGCVALTQAHGVELVTAVDNAVSLDPENADLQKRLDDAGIGTMIHYPVPPHLQAAYAVLGYGKGDFPVAETMAEEAMSLPIGPHMTEPEVERVAKALSEGSGRS